METALSLSYFHFALLYDRASLCCEANTKSRKLFFFVKVAKTIKVCPSIISIHANQSETKWRIMQFQGFV